MFATSISPWVVTKAALAPFRVSTPERTRPLLPYLREPGPMLYDIELEVRMRAEGQGRDTVISRTNYREMYYSAAQQVAHHAIGSLLELPWGGKEPLTLEDGVQRCFIEDGDTLTLAGWAQGDGYRIGFGTCEGKVLPAPALRPEWRDD